MDVVISVKLCQASARIAKLPVKKKNINFVMVNITFKNTDINAVFSFTVIQNALLNRFWYFLTIFYYINQLGNTSGASFIHHCTIL